MLRDTVPGGRQHGHVRGSVGRDDEGKRFIQHIIHLSKFSELKGHLVFIENYDVHVARTMVGRGVTSALIVDERMLVGIFTGVDALRLLAEM